MRAASPPRVWGAACRSAGAPDGEAAAVRAAEPHVVEPLLCGTGAAAPKAAGMTAAWLAARWIRFPEGAAPSRLQAQEVFGPPGCSAGAVRDSAATRLIRRGSMPGPCPFATARAAAPAAASGSPGAARAAAGWGLIPLQRPSVSRTGPSVSRTGMRPPYLPGATKAREGTPTGSLAGSRPVFDSSCGRIGRRRAPVFSREPLPLEPSLSSRKEEPAFAPWQVAWEGLCRSTNHLRLSDSRAANRPGFRCLLASATSPTGLLTRDLVGDPAAS